MPDADSVSKGLVEEIIFENEANGYKVVAIGGTPDFVAVGSMPDLKVGEMVEFSGEWVDHPTFGRQLKVSHYRAILPDSADAIYHYLCSGLIKGIGPRTAARLISLYGDRTLEVLRHEPERIARIKGIGLAKATRIASQLAEKMEYQELVLMLSPHGIGTGLVFRVYRAWGSGAADRIRANPYDMADEIDGIGFLTADRVALAMGLAPDAPARLASAIKYQLTQAVYQGHTWQPRLDLLTAAAAGIGLPPERLAPVLEEMLASGQLIGFDAPSQTVVASSQANQPGSGIASPLYYQIEKSAARLVRLLADTRPTRLFRLCDPMVAEQALAQSSQKLGIELAGEQHQALSMALQESFSVLTGGPGTGKTTIIRVLTDCIAAEGGRVLLAAPTGRAARRLTELTGCPAKTIHRLLALPFGRDKGSSTDGAQAWLAVSSEVTLACDLLVVDEVSMLDVLLFRSLLDAIVPGTRVLLVGDADQLPAIGPGQVLQDLLASGRVPSVRLRHIFRQSAESLIVRNAHRVLRGESLEIDQSFDSQFIVAFKEDASSMAQAALRLCTDILPGQYGVDPRRDVQLLTPSHKGPAGTQALNKALQGEIDEDETVSAHGIYFAIGDKVMQMRNQYELAWSVPGPHGQASAEQGKGVFNGEVGLVTATNPEDDELTVLFDDGRLVVYDRGALEDLDLAYAITIHKSQGSEYPVVVLVIPPTAPQLLNRNLLYTAVTRARQKLLLVTSRQILGSLLHRSLDTHRFTLLGNWLNPGPTQQLSL